MARKRGQMPSLQPTPKASRGMTRRLLREVATHLAERLTRLRTLADLRPLAFDAVPLEFHYSRRGRSARLALAVEIERLLGIQDYFLEAVYAVVDVEFLLPEHKGLSLEFGEGVLFNASQSSGQESEIYRRPSDAKAKLGSRMWMYPYKPVAFLSGIEAAICLRSPTSLTVRYRQRRSRPVLIYGGNRRIARTDESAARHPWHGASIAEYVRRQGKAR